MAWIGRVTSLSALKALKSGFKLGLICSTNYLLGQTVSGTEDTVVNTTDKRPALVEVTF